VLGSFGFPGDAADRRVGDLSGGERTRLALAKIMVNPVNLLVLDEPTNHLDLQSCDVLEDALRAYPGTVVLVSHDRYLIREVAQSLVAVRDGRARRHDGVDEAILSPSAADAAASTFGRAAPAGGQRAPGRSNTRPPGPAGAKGRNAAATAAKPLDRGRKNPGHGAGRTDAKAADAKRGDVKRSEAETRQARHKATRDLRSRVEKLERQLAKAEAEVADLQRQMADPAVYADSEKVRLLVEEHNGAKDKAAGLMDAWTDAQLALERAAAAFD
jgi:ATP-binding cassette subfamily F protein 3